MGPPIKDPNLGGNLTDKPAAIAPGGTEASEASVGQTPKGIHWRAVASDLEVHLGLAFRAHAHPRDHVALFDLVALPDDQCIIVSVSAQERIVVLDDDEIAVGRQTVACVDHLPAR